MPPEVEEILSFRSQICCFLAQKTHHGFFLFFWGVGGQNVLLTEIRDIAVKDIACYVAHVSSLSNHPVTLTPTGSSDVFAAYPVDGVGDGRQDLQSPHGGLQVEPHLLQRQVPLATHTNTWTFSNKQDRKYCKNGPPPPPCF